MTSVPVRMMVACGAWMNGRTLDLCVRLTDAVRKRDLGAVFKSTHGRFDRLITAMSSGWGESRAGQCRARGYVHSRDASPGTAHDSLKQRTRARCHRFALAAGAPRRDGAERGAKVIGMALYIWGGGSRIGADRQQREEVPMKHVSRLALGLAAVLVAAPAFAECPGHSSVTAQTQSTPAPVAQSTPAPASTAAAAEDAVILTQNQTQPTTVQTQE